MPVHPESTAPPPPSPGPPSPPKSTTAASSPPPLSPLPKSGNSELVPEPHAHATTLAATMTKGSPRRPRRREEDTSSSVPGRRPGSDDGRARRSAHRRP